MDRGTWWATVLEVAKESDTTDGLTVSVSHDPVGFEAGSPCGHRACHQESVHSPRPSRAPRAWGHCLPAPGDH